MTQIINDKLKKCCNQCHKYMDGHCAWLSLGNEYCDEIMNVQQEIERLNNIINGMEKFFQYAYDNEIRPLNDRKVSVWTICLDKLQELKESNK